MWYVSRFCLHRQALKPAHGPCSVPIKAVEIKIGEGWYSVPRATNNMWPYHKQAGPWSFPMPIRITSIADEVMEDVVTNAPGEARDQCDPHSKIYGCNSQFTPCTGCGVSCYSYHKGELMRCHLVATIWQLQRHGHAPSPGHILWCMTAEGRANLQYLLSDSSMSCWHAQCRHHDRHGAIYADRHPRLQRGLDQLLVSNRPQGSIHPRPANWSSTPASP